MSMRRLSPMSIGTIWLLLTAVACGSAAQTPQPAAPPAQTSSPPAAQTPGVTKPDAVAIIDGVAIPFSALDEAVAPQIAKLDEQAYEIRRQQLDELIANRLLADEAKRRGVPADALIKTEVTDKVAAVTDKDLAKFIEDNRSRLRADPATLVPQIRKYLEAQREDARRQAFLDELKTKAKVEVLLSAPARFRAPIDLAGAPVRGPQQAPVTIVEFSDFHCPYCRSVQETLKEVLAKYPTQVRLVYKHFPLDDRHPDARRVAEASWCADKQQRFWQFHDAVYASEPDGSSAAMTAMAGKAGLDVKAFDACIASGQAAPIVNAQLEEGQHFGVTGTPGFFINGRLMSGALPLSAFSEIIDEELAAATKAAH